MCLFYASSFNESHFSLHKSKLLDLKTILVSESTDSFTDPTK